MSSNKNEVFEYLIDQLRQQVTSNPYKQQCEDLAHEVQSLKNQLRDASELVDGLMEAITLMNGGVEAYKLVRKGRYAAEHSGGRKENTQECFHNWQFVNGKAPAICVNCGMTKSSECEHDWEYYYPNGRRCAKCGLVNL